MTHQLRAWAGVLVFQAMALPVAAGVSLDGKLAFLRNGEVWAAQADGQNPIQLTQDGSRIEDYWFSPDLRHLAYARVFSKVAGPGLWKKPDPNVDPPEKFWETHRCSVSQIVIWDLDARKVYREITPPSQNWIYMQRWLGPDQIFFLAAAGFDVWGHFLYDLSKDQKRKINEYHGYRLLYGFRLDFDLSGSLMAYVNDASTEEARQALHITDLPSGEDNPVFARPAMQSPKISHDRTRVAFVETEFTQDEVLDHYWIYHRGLQKAEKIYTGPAMAKNPRGPCWSPDDKWILWNTLPKALVLDAQHPGNEPRRLDGTDFNWLDNTSIICADHGEIAVKNIISGIRKPLLAEAGKPRLLAKE